VALVAGAFGGIGQACALRLAKAGWIVYGSGRRLSKGEALSQCAREQELSLHLVQLDVTNEASINEAIQHIEQEAGRLDLLVNNAGYSLRGAVTQASNDQIRRLLETNVIGLIAVTRAALPLMQRNQWGRVINMGSVQGKMALPGVGIYSASKFTVERISDAMRLEWKLLGRDFHVVLIEPSFTNTALREQEVEGEYGAQSQKLYGDYFATTARQVINARMDHGFGPEKVAEVVLKAAMVASPKARYSVIGFQTRLVLLLQRLLSDWSFDVVRMSYTGLSKHLAAQKRTRGADPQANHLPNRSGT
jgi:NADP-dependent 3-hydroxy acid dehydrogenase YdfG